MVGFLLTVVVHHCFVGDEGDPKDSEATMPGYDYFWDSAHAYSRRGKDQDELGFTQKQDLSKTANHILPSAHALVSSPHSSLSELCNS